MIENLIIFCHDDKRHEHDDVGYEEDAQEQNIAQLIPHLVLGQKVGCCHCGYGYVLVSCFSGLNTKNGSLISLT